jgi:hypothetical protein
MHLKFQATQIFTGTELLEDQLVLITQKDGTIEALVGIEEAGEDIQSFEGILSPGLINAHCHLELSHMKGMIPAHSGLQEFVKQIVGLRKVEDGIIQEAIIAAEDEMYHIGKIYQATNFIYTGLSAKRTDWKIKGLEHLHGATIADLSRGKENRAEWMRQKYGDNFYLEDRPRKHRYFYFIGSKNDCKKMKKMLPSNIEPYPKGDNKRYHSDYNPSIQGRLL